MTELKPCPFCGESVRDDEQELCLDSFLQMSEKAGPLFYLECFGCGIETRWFPTEAEAIAAWNRRATDRDMDYNPMEVAILGGDPTP